MAVRSVATTDTLDTFRTTFNSLASTDIGDTATMTTSASSIVGAVNELNSSVAGDLVIQTFGHRYNSDGSNIDRATLDAYKDIMNWSKRPPENSIAMKWIKKQRDKKKNG